MGRAEATRAARGRALKLGVLALLMIPVISGCSMSEVMRFGWPEGVTPQATQMRTLWTWSVVAAIIVGLITWGAMFWAIAFHRKKRNPDGPLPRQTQYNLPLEVVFTIIPTVIVGVLFAFTVQVQNYVDVDEPDPDVEIGVVAFQWNWRFDYPGFTDAAGEPVSTLGTSEEIPLLVLPTDQRIQFEQESSDVIHSFWVPEFLFKRDVFPLPEQNDQDNVWQIDAIEREGAFVGRCAELCGTYHSMMNFEVRAITPDLYDEWLTLRGQVNPDTGVSYSAGEALAALDCGELCNPVAYTTVPFDTSRTQQAAEQNSGG